MGHRLRLPTFAAAVISAALARGAAAATIPVTSSADDIVVNGNCTLREAVIAANSDTAQDACPAGNGTDTIQVPAGTYTLLLAGPGEDAAAGGDLDVTASVDVVGAGAPTTVIDGNATDRVLDIDPASTGISVTLSGLTIRNGSAQPAGGGIRNAGALAVSDCVFRDNTATGGAGTASGGGIDSTGTLTVTRSTIQNNLVTATAPPFSSAVASGGGIHAAGTLDV
ncbi:MAG TPA: CSLREA domain-containing protein, partial [Solirubrobacteraceae bacterium]